MSGRARVKLAMPAVEGALPVTKLAKWVEPADDYINGMVPTKGAIQYIWISMTDIARDHQ